jgi:hypothetical protein
MPPWLHTFEPDSNKKKYMEKQLKILNTNNYEFIEAINDKNDISTTILYEFYLNIY